MTRIALQPILLLAIAASAASAQPRPAAPAKVAAGAYECWAFSEPRPLLNFKILSDARYTDTDGKPGAYSYDPKTGRVAFKGGALDGAMPDGFYTVYHEPRGKPTVSFRSRRDAEVSFCEKK